MAPHLTAPDGAAPAVSAPALVPAPPARVPTHVAIIMDGNGRWAARRGLPRVAGHREGAKAVRRTIEAAVRFGVPWLTLYAFSSENWRRPADEVRDLTGLLRFTLRSELAELRAEGVRLRVIGDLGRYEPDLRAALAEAVASTAHNARLNLTVALNYGARTELLAAARAIAAAARDGRLDPETLAEADFEKFLSTAGMPDPDLILRTSGEHRLSNFLLYQAAYAEFAFPDVLWPDFDATHFAAALEDYAGRERRFGARPARAEQRGGLPG